MGHLIDLLNLQALALDAQGDLNQALSCLERALELAEPQGFVRIFLDNGSSNHSLAQGSSQARHCC